MTTVGASTSDRHFESTLTLSGAGGATLTRVGSTITAGVTGLPVVRPSDVAGYTGTDQRATYTCVGDTVNLAARLEAHTKTAGHAILIDSQTRAALGDAIAAEALGPMLFKGKTVPVEVFGFG